MANFSLNVKVNGAEQAVSTIGEIEAALAATKDELKGLTIGSDEFQTLSNQARTLQGELERSFEKATNFNSSLTVLTESVSRLGSTVAAGFSLVTSAFSIFADESEELTEAQVKAQQALTIAFAATTIATNAQALATDLKLVKDKLQLGLTNLLTAAVGRETVAKAASAAATGTATVAQRALNAAMNANPILLIVTALGALIGALTLFSDSTEEATEDTDTYTDAIQRNNEIVDRNIKQLREQFRVQIEIAKLRGEDVEAYQLETQLLEEELDIRKKQLDKAIKDVQDYVITQTDLLDRLIENRSKNAIEYYTAEADATSVFNQNILNIEKEFNQLREITDKEDFAKRKAEFLANTEELISILDGFLKYDPENTALKSIIDNYRNLTSEVTKIENDLTIKNEAELQKRRDAYKKAYDDIVSDVKKSIEELEKLETDYTEQLIKLRLDQAGINVDIINNELRLEQEKVDKIFELRQKEIDEFFGPNSKKAIALKSQLEQEKNETIASLNELFNFRRDLAKKEDDLAVLQAQERANRIALIQEVLQKEIAFGDQSTLDALETIEARRSELAVSRLLFDLENNKRSVESFKQAQAEILSETQKSLALRQQVEENELKARQQRDLENLRSSLIQEFGVEFQTTKEFDDIIAQFKKNQEVELQIGLEEIREDYRQKNEEATKKSEDEILAYRLEKLNQFQEAANQVFDAIGLGVDFFQALADLRATENENELIDLRTQTNERLNALNERYNAELEAQQAALAAGLINQEQYNAAILALDTNRSEAQRGLEQGLRDSELAAKKKAFEDEKKLRIASTIISGVQGALQAFAGAFQLGPIAGPIVGGILAALVGATTGIQVAAIKKQKFDDSGSVKVTTPNPSGAGPLGGSGGGAGTPGSAGGFTQFDESLLGPQPGSPGGGGGTADPVKVYVLESDISNAQNRVNVAESNATFG